MAIRFGFGNPEGMRSETWKVRAGSDGSIYITPRMLKKNHRGAYKVSLHPKRPDGSGGRWKIEWEDRYVQQHPAVLRNGETVLAEWESESVRLGPNVPIKEGFAVVLGRFSLGPHIVNDNPATAADEAAHLAKVTWERDLLDPDHAYQWTVLVGDPGDPVEQPPGTRAMGSTVIGVLRLGSMGITYVMRHVIPLTDRMRAEQKKNAQALASSMLEKDDEGNVVSKNEEDKDRPGVIRGTALGHEDTGLRWAMELAIPYGFTDAELSLL